MDRYVKINNCTIKLSNLDKVIWPDEGYTKADLVKYYVDIAPYILPHLKDRPFVMSRYPDGINGTQFYQKNCPDYAPDWIKTYDIVSESQKKKTSYILCNDEQTLIWLANHSCIEMHPWLSTIHSDENPDIAVFDLDPMPPLGFSDAAAIALMIKEILKEFKIKGYPKTSGSTGIHIFIPIEPVYSFAQIRDCIQFVFGMIINTIPEKTTMQRAIESRGTKVYLDYLQNSQGKTMAWHYSLRPRPGAPVSMPLLWQELENSHVNTQTFNITNAKVNIEKRGELFEEMLHVKQPIENILKYV